MGGRVNVKKIANRDVNQEIKVNGDHDFHAGLSTPRMQDLMLKLRVTYTSSQQSGFRVEKPSLL